MDKAFAEGYIPYGRRVSLSSAKRDRSAGRDLVARVLPNVELTL